MKVVMVVRSNFVAVRSLRCDLRGAANHLPSSQIPMQTTALAESSIFLGIVKIPQVF